MINRFDLAFRRSTRMTVKNDSLSTPPRESSLRERYRRQDRRKGAVGGIGEENTRKGVTGGVFPAISSVFKKSIKRKEKKKKGKKRKGKRKRKKRPGVAKEISFN